MKWVLFNLPKTKSMKLMLVVVIILVSYFFGIRGTNYDVLWDDESTTLGHIGALEFDSPGMSLSETVDSLATWSAQHPPLYYVGLNIWASLFSYQVLILRLFSVFWSVLTLAVLYRLACDIGGNLVAFYTICIAATSVMLLYYSHELREYSMLLFWAGLFWLLYWRISQRKSLGWIQLSILTLITLCSIYTSYTSIFLLITTGLYHLLFRTKNKVWWQVSGAILVAGIFYLPWIPTLLHGLQVTTTKLETGDPKLMYNNELVVEVTRYWGNGHEILLVVLIILGVLAAVLKYPISRDVLFFAAVIVAVILLINGNFVFIKRIRYVLITLLPIYLLGGYGLAAVHRLWVVVPIFLICWLWFGTETRTDDNFNFHTGQSYSVGFVEYNYLVPLLNDIQVGDKPFVTVINDFRSIKLSKQNKMSIEDFYLSPLGIDPINIHSHYAEDFEADEVMSQLTGSSFYLTYRGKGREPELEEFRSIIADQFEVCEQIPYGDTSQLIYYVRLEDFESLCTY